MAALVRQDFGLMAEAGFINGSFTNFTLNEATDQIEYIFQAREAVTITRLGFRYGLRALLPPTFSISLQGMDGSGRADGVIKGGGSPASATFTPPNSTAWDGTWQWVNLANSFTVAPGDFLSSVIIYSSGTIDATNNSSFSVIHDNWRASAGYPYSVSFNATGAVVTRQTNLPIFGYGSAGTAYGYPAQTVTNVAFTLNTTPDELALFFTVPIGAASNYQLLGFRWWAPSLAAAGTYKGILYDTDGTTVLQTVTVDTDAVKATTNNVFDIFFATTPLPLLMPGANYRIALQPQGTQSMTLLSYDFGAAADIDAWPGGQAFKYSSRVDAGAWTELATRRPMITPILAAITTSSHFIS